MAIKNILVAYNGSESSDAALEAALLMQAKYDAHLTGLLAHRSAESRLREETWVPDALRDTLDTLEAEHDGQIRARFDAACQGRVPDDQRHWIDIRGDADRTVADYAMLFDITLVGRRDAIEGPKRFNLHPDRIAVASGRPVLVVPRSFRAEAIHQDAVLAWDGQRAATRALMDAMQILETKRLVRVVTVDTAGTGTPLAGIDVGTALGRHGVEVEMVRVPSAKGGVAETLLDYCKGVDAGLLVMGAYQSSMFREELFGGVTKDVLAKSPIPVLLSH